MTDSETKYKRFWKSIYKNRMFYVLLLPVIVYYLIFKYGPIFGIVVAFEDFKPRAGIFGSAWVGLKHFRALITSADFEMVFRNTLIVSALKILFGFPAPIILALLINEVNNRHYKKVVQTICYMPHFLSWVIVAELVTSMLSLDGPVNWFTGLFGAEPVQFMIQKSSARAILLLANIWKASGWGTLIYLAAIAGIDQSQYESAVIDGASRFQQILYITLPSLVPTIVVLFVLRVGSVMNAGLEDTLMLQNSMTYDVLENIDTYVYKVGVSGANYSFATAVGLFKSIINLVLVLITNKVSDKLTGSALL